MGIVHTKIYETNSPNELLLDNEKLNWYNKDARSFSFLGDKGYLSDYRTTHINLPFKYSKGDFKHIIGDDEILKIDDAKKIRNGMEYSGRIWDKHLIISFWNYPETKEKLIKLLDILKEEDNTLDYHNYLISLPDGKFTSIDDYYNNRIKQNTNIDHIISPLNKNKKHNTSAYFKIADKKRKPLAWRQAMYAESMIVKPTINESPDAFFNPKTNSRVEWDNVEYEPISFGFYKKKFFWSEEIINRVNGSADDRKLGNKDKRIRVHSEIGKKLGLKRSDFEFPGRLWKKLKVISFWKFPTKKEMPDILEIIGEKIGVDLLSDPEWQIDIIYENILWKLIPISEYIGSDKVSSQELIKQHVASPMNKLRKPNISGYTKIGNSKRKPMAWRQAMYAESMIVKPTINESPDSINWPKNASPRHVQKIIYHDKQFPQRPFAYWFEDRNLETLERAVGFNQDNWDTKAGDFWLGDEGQGHADDCPKETNGALTGRVWTKFRVISFWWSPKRISGELKELASPIMMDFFKKLKDHGIDVTDWKFDGYNFSDEDNPGKWDNKWPTMYDFFQEMNINVSPGELKNLQTKENKELEDHTRSPLLKKQKEVPAHVGSKRYGERKPLAMRQAMQTSESMTIYERLYEKLLIGEPVSIEELRDILHKKVLNFEFIKLDGEVRPAKGTTMMKYVPDDQQPTGDNPSSDKVAAFYDLSKSAWRSVSNRSDEIVLIQDKETGKLKVQISDKIPIEEPTKPEISKVPGADPRPILPKSEPVVKPSIRPDDIPPTPEPEDIDVGPEEKPLDINDPTINADDVRDDEIIAPEVHEPEVEIPEPQTVPEVEPETPMEPAVRPEIKPETPEEELPPKEDITFPEDDEEEIL